MDNDQNQDAEQGSHMSREIFQANPKIVNSVSDGHDTASRLLSDRNTTIDIQEEEPVIPGSEASSNHIPDTTSIVDKDRDCSRTSSNTFSENALVACCLYSVCSISMVLSNERLAASHKQHMTTQESNLTVLLVASQAIIAIVCIELCKYMRWTQHEKFSIEKAKRCAPASLLFCGMLFTGMASLQHNSIPVVAILKNSTNSIFYVRDCLYFEDTVGIIDMVANALLISSAFMTADITCIGFFWMAANCLTTAAYTMYISCTTKADTSTMKLLSKFEIIFYNNFLCILILIPTAFMRGEFVAYMNTPGIQTWSYLTKVMVAGFTGFLLNCASLNCIYRTGPTTYNSVGLLNKILWSISSYSVLPLSSLLLFVLGGILYFYAKIDECRKEVANNTHVMSRRTNANSQHAKITLAFVEKIIFFCLIFGFIGVVVLFSRDVLSILYNNLVVRCIMDMGFCLGAVDLATVINR